MTIDHDLRAALDVDPSPAFLARVRARIAEEPPPKRWGASWFMVAGASAAFAVLVIAIGVTRRAPAETRASGVLVSRSLTTQVVIPDRKAQALRNTRSAEAVALLRHTGSAEAVALLPDVAQPFRATFAAEILLDPREASALRRLIDGGPLKPEHTYAGPATTPIEIELIVIEPLTSGEGVRP